MVVAMKQNYGGERQMSQVFGYICSDDRLTAAVMQQAGESLGAVPREARVGLGIGYLQDGRSLLRKRPKGRAASVNLPSLISDIPSQSMVGHIRHERMGRVGNKELQPYRFRDWVYAQCGLGEGAEKFQEPLVEGLPDHVERNVGGTATAEAVFHEFYRRVESELGTTAKAKRPRLYARALAETIAELEKLSREQRDRGLENFQAVAVTDRCMVAANIGGGMSYRVFEGIEVAEEEPLFAGHKPQVTYHDRFRAVMIANAISDPEWESLEDRELMWVDRKWGIHREGLASLESAGQ